MQNISAFLSGFIFGIGLLISGMANPAKVLAFLDITGLWDPSLAFVMLGAISIGFIAFFFAKKMSKSICGAKMQLPSSKTIDKKLIIGSILFGVGWGLVGFCPGPAIVAVGAGKLKAFCFTLAMIVAMGVYELFQIKNNN